MNNETNGKGSVLQFVDIAERVYYGELLNDRSIGIEFVNPPFEEYKKDKNDKVTTEKKFNLDTSERACISRRGLAIIRSCLYRFTTRRMNRSLIRHLR